MLHESPVLLKSWVKLQSEASSLNTATCYKYRSCPNSPQPHEELGKLVLLPSPHPPIYPTAAKGGSMEGWKESSGCEVQAWRKGASAGAGMPASNPPAQYREGSESISHREGGINLHTYSLAVGLSKGSVSPLASEHVETGNCFSPGASVTAEQGDAAAAAPWDTPTMQRSLDAWSRPLAIQKT